MASVPWCGVAWLPPGRDIMKAESGKKAIAKMSNEHSGFPTGWQQQHCPELVFWWLVVWIPPTPFSSQHSPGSGTAWAGKLKARFKVRTREQGSPLSGNGIFQSENWWAGQIERSPDPSAIC